MARYSVFGLGYVGSTMAAALCSQGHEVVALDPSEPKRQRIERGESPVGEPGIREILSAAHREGRLRATEDTAGAMGETALAFVCVGTPSRAGGSLDTGALARVTRQIAQALPRAGARVGVVYRSTMLPGTMEDTILPILERAWPGGEGSRFEVAFYPEFMREGNGLEDYFRPSRIVVGARTPWIREALTTTFPSTEATVFWTDFRTAELVKYADNAFHAAKITFSNEMGMLAKSWEVDAAELMRIFASDGKLNLSSAYLRPGFAFGGSCLPKDLRALLAAGGRRGVQTPLLGSILASNREQIARVRAVLRERGAGHTAGFIGLSFKPGTDDLRESPTLALAGEAALGGQQVLCHDPDVRPDDLVGANREHAEATFPGLAEALTPSALEIWSRCSVVVTARAPDPTHEPQVRACIGRGGFVIDLVPSPPLANWCGRSYWGVV